MRYSPVSFHLRLLRSFTFRNTMCVFDHDNYRYKYEKPRKFKQKPAINIILSSDLDIEFWINWAVIINRQQIYYIWNKIKIIIRFDEHQFQTKI